MDTCDDIKYEKKSDICATHFHNTDTELGHGDYGSVYQACCNNDCTYAMKINNTAENNTNNVELDFDNEIDIQNLCAEHNYALPIYEIQTCDSDKRKAFVTDRLDISLDSDLFSLSPIQNKQMQYIYKKLYGSYIVQIPSDHKSYSSLNKEWSKLSTYTSAIQYNAFYRLLRKTFIGSSLKSVWKDVEPKQLIDSSYNKRRKLKSILLALNVLDGIHKLGINHNDSYPRHFMRRQNEEQYVMIDFGKASKLNSNTTHNPDIELFKQQIQHKVDICTSYSVYNNGNDYIQKYPISVNLNYLVEALPIIQTMATADYFTVNAIQEKVDTQLEEFFQRFLGKKVKSSTRRKQSSRFKSSTRRKQSSRFKSSRRKI